jgi:hypothetical protein
MAAVRNHHVFVLISHVDGSNWLVNMAILAAV